MSDNQNGARFIDCEYHELFRLPPGEKLHLRFFDGREMDAAVKALDEYHVEVSRIPFHICEYAERCRELGIVIRPQNPRRGDVYDTYEIYQLTREPVGCYRFCGYDTAYKKIQAEDYIRTYAGMLAKEMDLDAIYQLHNTSHRPFPGRMHAVSVSDIVVTTRDGKETAFYLDNIGFREMPGFAQKLRSLQARSPRRTERDER